MKPLVGLETSHNRIFARKYEKIGKFRLILQRILYKTTMSERKVRVRFAPSRRERCISAVCAQPCITICLLASMVEI